MKFKIALVQLKIKRFEPETNLSRIENFIKKAREDDAELIVFPEYFITDPLIGKTEYADEDQKYKKHFQALADKYAIDIVTGSLIEKDKKGFYNTTYYIDSEGEILSQYRKVNLWLPERDFISAGNKVPVFDTKFGRVGVIICWDIAFPEMFRKMVKQGAQIILCPSYWCYGEAGNGIEIAPSYEIKLIDALCEVRAYENEVVFAYCNAAGGSLQKDTTQTLIGHSQLTVPFKGCIKRLEHNSEEMFVEEVDMSILDIAEESKKIREDLKNRVLY